MRGLDAEQRREQRREQVLRTTLELFAGRGYQNVSIELICQTAYVSTKSFYELFDSKETCYLALLRELTGRIQDRMQTALGADAVTMDDLVAEFARALVEDPRVAWVTFGQASGISPQIERQRRANRQWAASFLITAWRASEIVPPGSRQGRIIERTAIGVIGGLFDIIADWLIDHDPTVPAQVTALISDLNTFHHLVCAGLRAHRASVGRPRG